MTTLLQVSDTHFGTEQAPVVSALISLSHELAPDVLVVSGDITQRARRGQFRAARNFVDAIAPPCLVVIPGNHDIPLFNVIARAFAPYGNYSRAFGGDLEPSFQNRDLLLIGVNTTRPRRRKDGELSARQIKHVSERLRSAAPSQLRIVVVHQPVFAIRPGDERNLLHGHRIALPVWAEAGADIVMGGHIHLPYVRSLRATFPDLPREVWTVQAGTAVSSRIREGIANSVNVVRCVDSAAPRRCTVERWDYSAPSRRFVMHTAQTLEFDAADTTTLARRRIREP
jgi:3',5'-cyclic AMP phosphodiesterase CpdA